MAFDILFDKLKEEIAKEMDIREEIIYKKGFAEGIKEAESKCSKCKRESSAEEEAYDEAFAEGYLEGLEDAWGCVEDLFNMSIEDRIALFDTSAIRLIIENYHPLDVLELWLDNYKFLDEESEEDEDLKTRLVGAILDANISDDSKRTLLDFMDKVEDIKIVKL